MLIANPLFDVVFRFLLADLDAVNQLVSPFCPQHLTSWKSLENTSKQKSSEIWFYNFSANELLSGKPWLVSIGKLRHTHSLDMKDFPKSSPGQECLRIFFMDTPMKAIEQAVAVFHDGKWKDLAGNELPSLDDKTLKRLEGIDLLVQIPRVVVAEPKGHLHEVLSYFDQNRRCEFSYGLHFPDHDRFFHQPLFLRLVLAGTSYNVRKQIEVELKYDRGQDKKLQQDERDMAQFRLRGKSLDEIDQRLLEIDKKLQEKEKILEQSHRELTEKMKLIQQLGKS